MMTKTRTAFVLLALASGLQVLSPPASLVGPINQAMAASKGEVPLYSGSQQFGPWTFFYDAAYDTGRKDTVFRCGMKLFGVVLTTNNIRLGGNEKRQTGTLTKDGKSGLRLDVAVVLTRSGKTIKWEIAGQGRNIYGGPKVNFSKSGSFKTK